MGEYAKINGEQVKIGTCESMYYLRYEDRYKVKALDGNVNPATELNLFWRLPYPDEDRIEIGNYDPYNRGQLLVGFTAPDTIKSPGNLQLTHPSGLLANIPCLHGNELPEVTGLKLFWNGKTSNWYELAFVKNTNEGVKPIIRCLHCQTMWRCEWSEVLPFISDQELVKRLNIYEPNLQLIGL